MKRTSGASDGPDCMLSWPCRVVLSRFQSSQVEMIGNTRAFAPKKRKEHAQVVLTLAKQFVVYLDRVAMSRDYYFTADPDDGRGRPEDVIELTSEQLQTWQSIRRLARQRQNSSDIENDDTVEDRLLEMWLLIISHNTGARRYRSPLLSFVPCSASNSRRRAGWSREISTVIYLQSYG